MEENNISYNKEKIPFEVFPNPSTTGLFSVSLGKISSTKINSFISNTRGDIIYQTKMNENKSFEIDISSQTEGTYFLLLQIDNQVFVKKLIKI